MSDSFRCPRCGIEWFVPPIPAHMVVVVFGCHACDAPVALFHGRALLLKDSLMKSNDTVRQREHIADVIGEFIKGSLVEFLLEPISDCEVDDFVNIDLNLMDDADYFRKVFCAADDRYE